MINCGMSEVNITPKLGLNIPGYLNIRNATGVKDELFAKAMVFSDEKAITGLVAIDALDLELIDVKRIRSRICQLTDMKEENIMVCLTHAHTGGPVVNSFVSKRDEEYIRYLVNKASDAVILAYKKMQPVKIGSGKGFVDNISFNRRYYMKDGTLKTNPGKLNPMIDKPAGPIDEDVMVVKIEDLAGNILGAIVNFACHLDVVGGEEYSGDYPGELSNVLKSVYGENFVCLFLNGLSGDINHTDTNTSENPSDIHYKKMGQILAGETIKVLTSINYQSESIELGSEKQVLSIPSRIVTKEELANAQREIESESTSEIDKVFANEIVEFNKIKPGNIEVEAQVIKIGDAAIIGFPGDVFVKFALRIKKESKFKYNIVCSHTNGRNGYIPTREAFKQGGYEVRTSRSNKLAHEAGDTITDTILGLIKEM